MTIKKIHFSLEHASQSATSTKAIFHSLGEYNPIDIQVIDSVMSSIYIAQKKQG